MERNWDSDPRFFEEAFGQIHAFGVAKDITDQQRGPSNPVNLPFWNCEIGFSSNSGSLDILISNSVGRSVRPYQDALEAWRQSMDVNGTGLFAISRAFLDLTMERGRGTIINIGSIQSVIPQTSAITPERR